jgi:hypothetical protein
MASGSRVTVCRQLRLAAGPCNSFGRLGEKKIGIGSVESLWGAL